MNPTTCADCIHFRRDEINPVAGLGFCELRNVSKYPEEPHYCRKREVVDDDLADAQTGQGARHCRAAHRGRRSAQADTGSAARTSGFAAQPCVGQARTEITKRGNGMSRRATDLEARLVEWGKEYGGGKYENTGWQGRSPLASMMKWHGRPPDGLGYQPSSTPADDVDAAVRALALQPEGRLPAIIVALEYWLPGQNVEAKQQKLRRMGDNVSRVRYYQHLRLARIHIAAWLHIAFSEDEIDEEVASA